MMRAGSKRSLTLGGWMTLLASVTVGAATLDITYQPPATGVSVKVSAPDPTTTPIVIDVVIDGKMTTAAVLALGWYRYKAIVADGARNQKIAQNPKATAFPSEAEFLVPVDKTVVLVAHSHGELVGTDIKTCTVPFAFKAREGYRYSAHWQVTQEGCRFGMTEQALQPADSPVVPLVSLAQPDKAK